MDLFLAEIEGRAFRIAQLATGNREDALDIVQDAMIKLVQKYGHLEPSAWKPLFYSILESRILDWHRRQNVRSRFRSWLNRNDEEETEDALEQLPGDDGDIPEFKLQDSEFIAALDKALAELPLRQQQVFLLRIMEGMDIADTAKIMKCSESSVKTHYARALEKLRVALKEHHS